LEVRKMRAFALSLSLILSGLCIPAPASGAAQPPLSIAPTPSAESAIPRLSGHVNDYAGILTSQQRAALERRLSEYERETTHQIVVLTVSSLPNASIESFSLRVARAWKLGRKDFDNGVLVTVAPRDRKMRIEVGEGLSRFVSDSAAAKIIEESMVPDFRAGQFGKGIERGVERLMEECRAYKVNP
jgi:uncharacterized protein